MGTVSSKDKDVVLEKREVSEDNVAVVDEDSDDSQCEILEPKDKSVCLGGACAFACSDPQPVDRYQCEVVRSKESITIRDEKAEKPTDARVSDKNDTTSADGTLHLNEQSLDGETVATACEVTVCDQDINSTSIFYANIESDPGDYVIVVNTSQPVPGNSNETVHQSVGLDMSDVIAFEDVKSNLKACFGIGVNGNDMDVSTLNGDPVDTVSMEAANAINRVSAEGNGSVLSERNGATNDIASSSTHVDIIKEMFNAMQLQSKNNGELVPPDPVQESSGQVSGARAKVLSTIETDSVNGDWLKNAIWVEDVESDKDKMGDTEGDQGKKSDVDVDKDKKGDVEANESKKGDLEDDKGQKGDVDGDGGKNSDIEVDKETKEEPPLQGWWGDIDIKNWTKETNTLLARRWESLQNERRHNPRFFKKGLPHVKFEYVQPLDTFTYNGNLWCYYGFYKGPDGYDDKALPAKYFLVHPKTKTPKRSQRWRGHHAKKPWDKFRESAFMGRRFFDPRLPRSYMPGRWDKSAFGGRVKAGINPPVCQRYHTHTSSPTWPYQFPNKYHCPFPHLPHYKNPKHPFKKRKPSTLQWRQIRVERRENKALAKMMPFAEVDTGELRYNVYNSCWTCHPSCSYYAPCNQPNVVSEIIETMGLDDKDIDVFRCFEYDIDNQVNGHMYHELFSVDDNQQNPKVRTRRNGNVNVNGHPTDDAGLKENGEHPEGVNGRIKENDTDSADTVDNTATNHQLLPSNGNAHELSDVNNVSIHNLSADTSAIENIPENAGNGLNGEYTDSDVCSQNGDCQDQCDESEISDDTPKIDSQSNGLGKTGHDGEISNESTVTSDTDDESNVSERAEVTWSEKQNSRMVPEGSDEPKHQWLPCFLNYQQSCESRRFVLK